MTETAPTAMTARVPATFQSRSKVPNVAQNSPAVANKRSPPTPAAADRRERFSAEHQQAGNDDRAADDALEGRLFVENERSKDQARQRSASRLDCGAMAERHQNEAAVGEQGLRRPRQDGHHRSRGPSRCRQGRASPRAQSAAASAGRTRRSDETQDRRARIRSGCRALRRRSPPPTPAPRACRTRCR